MYRRSGGQKLTKQQQRLNTQVKVKDFEIKGSFEVVDVIAKTDLRGLDESKHMLIRDVLNTPRTNYLFEQAARRELENRWGMAEPAEDDEAGLAKYNAKKASVLQEIEADIRTSTSMQTACGEDIRKALKRDVIRNYKRKDGDTGSPEVQVALITIQLNNMKRHLLTNHKDNKVKLRFKQKFHRRRYLMQYLKRRNFEKYIQMLEDCDMTEQEVWMWNYDRNRPFRFPRQKQVYIKEHDETVLNSWAMDLYEPREKKVKRATKA